MSNFPYLISLNLSMCEIKEMTKDIFQPIGNLRILDLSYNKIKKIPSAAFIGLRKLKMLILLGNRDISLFEPYSLNGLSSIRKIEITGSNIYKISSHTFAGLNLDKLRLSDNNIHEMEDNVFSGMSVKIIDMENNKIKTFNKGLFRGASGITALHTPAFKYCCVRPNYLADKDCFPEKDEFSSCADLLRVSALQTMLWLIGILALFGNIASVIYRLVYDREKLKLGFGIFVTNLAVADFLMGIYLITIAVADATYRSRYIFMDDYWRNSGWCKLAGFLSTVSSEASVFFLCLITLDRLLVIKYPFGQIRFNTKNAGISSGVAWVISVSVGLIPILYEDYFQDRFYSKSGVCIALPLTRDRPPGWLYSIIIFIGLNFLTFCLIAIGQVILYSEITKTTSGIRRSTRRGKKGLGRRTELNVARNLLLVVTTDFLCWFPIGVMGMMAMSGHVIPGEVYAWTAVCILPINSALNPVLYTLTAFLGKRKAQSQQNTQPMSFAYQSHITVRKSRPFKGLFRYFITKADEFDQMFVSLEDLDNKDTTLTSKAVLTCVQNLTRCLCLLHRNSLMVKLDGRSVYLSVADGRVIGDVQIRQEPSGCTTNEMKKESMHELGKVVRRLLVISQKTKKHHAEYIEN
ncbi:G-protein coupled receptor GRL101-like [Mercenaria mercenaria]|uniref:G-protein coupled receptor GRL101-like n=1 Tax=Mercenaria mercenaria TaxID=6596 RepID=UPI00234E5CDF|nr:G-protein coupled receptor GRL101-like [Mercenaria mercenaria]